MIEPSILQLAIAALSGTMAGSVLSYLTSRRKAPVERESAHAAASSELAEAAAALVAPLSAEVKRLDARVAAAEADAAEARKDAAAARRDAKLAGEADDYIRDLHAHWDAHRILPRPPRWRWLSAED